MPFIETVFKLKRPFLVENLKHFSHTWLNLNFYAVGRESWVRFSLSKFAENILQPTTFKMSLMSTSGRILQLKLEFRSKALIV